MAKMQEDLSNFAAFDIDDLLAEINSKQGDKKEVTAYLDRTFILNSIKEYEEEAAVNKQEFTTDHQIDFTDFNFTGADLRGFKRSDLELFNFTGCDITAVNLDRISLEFFLEYMKQGTIIFQGLILDGTYLGAKFIRRTELGIECYNDIDLSNLNFSGSSFRNTDIEGAIFENTNISGCDFQGALNLDPKQFAFSIGFESAIFYKDKNENNKIIDQIKKFSNELDPDQFYNRNQQSNTSGIVNFLLNLTNVLDD
jgi:uncharacterized protein YjbI with pentapeptide repeats